MKTLEEQLPQVFLMDRVARRWQRAVGFGAGAVVLAILAIAIATPSLSSSTNQSAAAEVDIRLGGAPLQVSSGLGSVWVATCQRECSSPQRNSGQLIRVDSRTGRIVQRIDVADFGGFAIGDGAIWVAHFWAGSVSRIDLRTGHSTRTIKLVLPTPIVPGDRQFLPNSISAGRDSVWVTTARGWVARIDARSGRVGAMLRAPRDVTGNAVTGPHGTWIAESGLGVGLVHATSHRVLLRAIRSGRYEFAVDQLAVGDGRLWLYGEIAVPAGNGVNYVLTNRARLIALDERNGRLIHQQPFPNGPYGIAFGNDALFAANYRTGRLYRIDARYRVHALPPVRGPGTLIAVTPGALWATTKSEVLQRIAVRSPAHKTGSAPTRAGKSSVAAP